MESNVSLEEQIILYIKQNAEGVNKDSIQNTIDAENNEIVEIINQLIYSNKIAVSEIAGEPIFKYRNEREVAKFKDLNFEEIQTLEVILNSSSNGITTNEIKAKTAISTNNLINKILKKLEKKLLIKSLKMIGAKSKKVKRL